MKRAHFGRDNIRTSDKVPVMQGSNWPELDRSVSRIGLGCARLTGGMGMRQSEAIVRAALDVGITHFDTAPSYGFGTSENALGKILQGVAEATITTKVGIRPSGNGNLKSTIRTLARPMLAKLPGLKAKLSGAIAQPKVETHDHFDLDFVRTSVSESLKALRRDRLEMLLLHEPSSPPENNLGEFLESLRKKGQVGLYGIGTGQELRAPISLGSVAQYRWSPATPALGRHTILHGALRWWLPTFARAISDLRSERQDLLDRLGLDLADDRIIPGLLLTFALRDAPSSIFLISSNTPDRITTLTRSVNWEFVNSQHPEYTRIFDAIKEKLVVST